MKGGTSPGALHFVDEPPRISLRTGMLVFTIVSGADEHQFAMTSHAAQAMLEAARRAVAELTDEQRNVVPFPSRPAKRRKGRA